MSEPITMQYFTEVMEKVNAVHKVLEDFTPPEALDVLRIVRSNLKAEIRDFNEFRVADDSISGSIFA